MNKLLPNMRKVPYFFAVRCLILLFSFTSVLLDSVYASHISGGEITYECLGGNQYLITLNLYRDCDGITMGNSESITVESSCGTQTLTANLINPGGTEVSQICPQQISQTSCNNGNLPGMEQYTYQVTATLTPCSDWVINWSTCCRNTTVNVPTSSGDGSYIEATMNSVTDSCNNSPSFSSQPIPYVCSGQPVVFNWGTTETNGDSTTYQLIAARDDLGNSLTYTTPYSATNPINGITINPSTGELTFTSGTLGNFILVVQVNEYDSANNLIGTIMRDIQFVVIACTNNPPPPNQGQIDSANFSGTANLTGPYSIEMCDGGTFSFTITYTDPDLTDTLVLTSNVTTILPGCTFNPVAGNPATATISWTAPGSSTYFNSFTVFVNDGSCPVPGIQSTNFQVAVIPGTVALPDTTILCGTLVAQLSATGGNTFVWSVISGDPMVEGVNFSCDSCPNPVASPAITTFYEVVSDLTTATCVNRDTVQVKVVPEFSYSKFQGDSAICLQEDVQFTVNPDSTSASYTYDWIPSGIFDNDSIFNPIATFNTPGTKSVYFEITSQEGCSKNDSMQVVVSAALKPDVLVVGDTSICFGDSSQLNATILNAIPQSCGLSVTGCAGTPSPITIGTGTSTLSNTSYPAPYGNWYMGVKHQILFRASELLALGFQGGQIISLALNVASISGTTTYNNFEIKMGCTSLTSISSWQSGLVTVFPAQTINITTGWNTHTFSTGFDWDGNSNIIVEICFNNQPLTWTNNSPTYYTATSFNSVIYYNADGTPNLCTSPGFANTSMSRPNIKFNTCGAAPPSTYVYSWFPGIGLNDSSIANPWANPPTDTSYTVTVTDTVGGCADTASVNLTVVPGFTFIKTQTDSIICKGDIVQFIASPDSATPPYTYSWIPGNGVTFDDTSIFNPTGTFDSSGTKNVYFTISNFVGCEKSDSMTVFVGSAPKPIVSILADTTICAGDSAQLNAVIINGGSSSNYSYDWSPGIWLADSTAANVWSLPLADTSYTVIVKDTVGDCSDTMSINLYVVPGFTFTKDQSEDSICMTEQVLFGVTPDSTGNPYSYSWTPANIMDNSTISTPTGTFDTSGIKTIYFTISNSGGCNKTDSMEIFVAPVIKPDITVTGDTTLCAGESSQLGLVNNLVTNCNYLLSMYDDFGDGWNGATLFFFSNGVLVGNYTFTSGDSASVNIPVTGGAALSVSFTSGTFPTEESYILYDAQGNILFQDGPSPGNGTVWTGTGNCPGAGFSNYFISWTPGNTLSDDSIPTPIATPPATTLYTVVVTDLSGTCSDTSTINVDVGPSFSYNLIQSDTAICLGETVQFNAIPGAGTYTYQWTPATNLNSATISNPVAGPMNVPGNFSYTLNITSSVGCNLDSTLSFVVSQGDIPDITINGDSVICEGENSQITATSAGGNSPTYSFVWSPGATLSNDSINNPIATPPASITYTVTVTDTIGHCSDIAAYSITVNPYPDVQINPLTDSVCFNDNVIVLTATPDSGKWSGSGTTNNGYFAPGLAGLGSHLVFYQDSVNGCFGYDTLLLNVYLNPAIPTAFTSDTPYCALSNIDSLKAISGGGNITWYSNSNLTDTLYSGTTVYDIPAGTDSFDVWVTETSLVGCESNGAFKLTIQVIPNPMASFSASTTEGLSPLDVSFSNTSQPDSIDFTWDFAGLGTSNSDNPSFIFNQPGTYEVILISTDSNGCGDTTKATIIVNENVEDSLVIPNIFTPNGDGKNDVFKIQFTTLSEFHIAIFSRWGKKVYESKDPAVGWDGKDLQGQRVHAGVYFYVITAKDRNGNPITIEEVNGTVTVVRD